MYFESTRIIQFFKNSELITIYRTITLYMNYLYIHFSSSINHNSVLELYIFFERTC